MTRRFAWTIGLLACLILSFFVIKGVTDSRVREGAPPGSPGTLPLEGEELRVSLPKPELGRVVPFETSAPEVAGASGELKKDDELVRAISEEKRAVEESLPGQGPKAFTPPPEEARRLKKEGAITY